MRSVSISRMETSTQSDEDDPYQTPQSELDWITPESDYTGKLYSPLGIAIASVFGSVLATGLLIQSNYAKFQQNTHGLITIVITTIVTTLFLFMTLFIEYPSSLLYIVFNFFIAVLAMPLVHTLQGARLNHHEEKDREFHSVFRAAGIGVASLIAMTVMLKIAFTMFFSVAVVTYS